MKKLLILSIMKFVLCNSDDNHDKCGYASCKDYDPKLLNVHLVPHSHNDVAWVKTFDEYYYQDVRHILDSVVESLWMNPKRKFVYVETAFFWKWWRLQCSEVRTRVQVLVQLGQLQFAGGAWSMNDEATTHYQSIIDQFTYGLSKLDEMFGPCARPLVGWQIDPFGHSREFASLLAAMGYDALILDRIEHYDKERRKKLKQMEMIWRGDDDLGESSNIFTSVLSDSYTTPPRFCFDKMMRCGNNNNQYWFSLNPEDTIRLFRMYIENQAQFYRTNNILVPMGGDFHFQHAKEWYMYLDKMIELLNSKKDYKMKAFYSTPNCYFEAVKKAFHYNLTNLPKKNDDFFPYANEPNTYWTGFYTSRPSLKFFERDANRYFQMVKQLQVLAELSDNNLEFLEEFKSAMGLMQHHDSITGTQKAYVAKDLIKILDNALEDSLVIANQAFNKYLNVQPPLDFKRCLLNESSCYISEGSKRFIVSVYNPIAWEVREPIRIPVTFGSYDVFDKYGLTIETQLVDIPTSVKKIPSKWWSNATHEIVFIAKLAGLSFETYYIVKLNEKDHESLKVDNGTEVSFNKSLSQNESFGQVELKENVTLSLETNSSKTNISNIEENLSGVNISHRRDTRSYPGSSRSFNIRVNEKGELTHIDLKDGLEIQLSTQFFYYPEPFEENSKNSGAYAFHSDILKQVFPNINETIKGPVLQEIRSLSDENVHSTIRLYYDLNYIESEWVIGPIQIADRFGKQYVIKYVTDLKNMGVFYTDSNGKQIMRRKVNERATFQIDLKDKVAGNYYPITNRIFIENEDHITFTVLTDRAEGGTSLADGEVEIMLHRRLLQDDGFGVQEPLNEVDAAGRGIIVRGKHRLLFTKVNNATQRHENRKKVKEFHLQPIVLLADAKYITFETWEKSMKTFSWIKNIPDGIHILTLEPLGNRMLLLRLENFTKLPISIDLKKIFATLKLTSFTETKLAGDIVIRKWHENNLMGNFNNQMGNFNSTDDEEGLVVKIWAKEIRTFIADY